MTVNIGLVTSDALVFGCDSVASMTEYFLNPFALLAPDKDGKIPTDDEGRFGIKFSFDDIQPLVTSAWGGVTKMFQIHPEPSPVVAVTAGQAKLRERSIASHAEEFFRNHSDGPTLVNVEPICRAFLKFMRRRYDSHYKGSPLPQELRVGPEFLVGGIGRDDTFPSLFRLSVQRNELLCHFSGGTCGVSWNGQTQSVERFLKGFDQSIQQRIERELVNVFQEHGSRVNEYISELVNGLLDDLDQQLPEGMTIAPPTVDRVELPWEDFGVPIDYANLPLQEAVNLVSAMVMTEASRARFALGVATVGGRTHIGVVTKSRGFKALNEPELQHKFTGLSSDV